MGICNVQHKKDIVEWNNIGMPDCKEMMPEASDKGKPMARTDAVRHRTKVASHTAVPMGTAKWLVKDCPPIIISLPLGRRHGLLMSLA